MNKISTENYKGVRDFYPEDQFIQNYIFSIWKNTLESFGYEQYDASIFEFTDLYKAKTGEEIVNEQTYSFKDRGDRDVTLRPEMTPTIARMITKKKRELVFPLRWYSIPNLFRYEKPQKGRLREHRQLNVDIFGVDNFYSELEIVEIAHTLLREFGLDDTKFEIRINDRQLLNKTFADMGLNEIESHQVTKLLDRKNKIKDFDEQLEKIIGKDKKLDIKPNEFIQTLLDNLKERGISNVVFDSTITRGFDYYTGFVFEVFDTGGENNRSLFGGGRYDDLLDIFGENKLPAVGFGAGDVTIRDVLETYDLIPEHYTHTELTLCPLNDSFFEVAADWATNLREKGLNVSVDFSGKKVGDQIKKADKRGVKFVACIGDKEASSKKVAVKNLETGKEKKLSLDKIVKFIKSQK